MTLASGGPIRKGLAVVVLLACAGCATPGVGKPPATRPPAAELGTLGIAPVGWPPEMVVWTPSGAAAGAREGAKTAAGFMIHPLGFLLGLAFYGAGFVIIPATGALVGAAVGTAKGPPAREVRAFHGVASPIVLDVRFAETLQELILQRLRSATPVWAVLLPEDDTGGPASVHDGYRSLATRGIDAVLEVRVVRVDIAGPWGTWATGAIGLSVRARVVRVPDGPEVWTGEFQESFLAAPFTGDPEGLARLRDEFAAALRSLATRVADALTDRTGEPIASEDGLNW